MVLGRIVVLCYSSWCLNTGSCSFHLFVARKQGGRVVQGRTIVLCYAGWFMCVLKLVLEHSGSWCFLLVGARETRELALSVICRL